MYLKITDESQLNLLRQVNPYIGKRKLPDGVLGLVRKILHKEKLKKLDYIAIFLKPVKNDNLGLFDELKFYPDRIDTNDEDFFVDLKQGGSKYKWACYKIKLKESGARIYLIYCMKKKDVRRKTEI